MGFFCGMASSTRVFGAGRTLIGAGGTARVSRKLYDRLESLPQEICDIAWKAQARLCRRWRLAALGEPKVVVTTAIAREMAGLIWAIARQVQPTVVAC